MFIYSLKFAVIPTIINSYYYYYYYCNLRRVTCNLQPANYTLSSEHAQHLEVIHVRFGKIKIWKFEWCLYNTIDAYVCNLKIKLKLNELLCSWEIVNQHLERKECFSTASLPCPVRTVAWKRKLGFSRHAYNYDIDAYVCNI